MIQVALSLGDPAGIGLLVSVPALKELRNSLTAVCFGDGERARKAFLAAGWPPADVIPWPEGLPKAGQVGIANVAPCSDDVVSAHRPSAEGGASQLKALAAAADAVAAGTLHALVTGPTSKTAIVESGVAFAGQTEWLAERCGLAPDAVSMLFLGPRLRVGLVTTHVSVRSLPDEVTGKRVRRTIRHLAAALARLGEQGPIEIAGLNPHAGEGGLFGSEELETIGPAVQALREDPTFPPACPLVGPVPSEAAFRRAVAKQAKGVVAMMHDQATIASKLLDFGDAVNVTWGLPFVRTSVDHGVAYDAAARGIADHRGMRAALALAQRLARPR